MTTWSARTAASSDDAWASNITTAPTLTGILSVPGQGSSSGGSGARFLNVTIPQSTTLTNATLTLTAQATYSGPTALQCQVACQAADNAATFTTANGNLNTTNRPRTAYTAAWDIHTVTAGSTYTVDITAPVQAVLNRSGWASGNALVVLIDALSTTPNAEWQDFESYDSTPAKAPLLTITYGSGGTAGSVSAVVATATAAGIAPAAGSATNGSVTAVAAPAAADGPAPTVNAVRQAAVTGVAATASAAAGTPVVGTSAASHAVSAGNGYTDVTPRQCARTSDNRLWLVTWDAFDSYPQGSANGLTQHLTVRRADQTGAPSTFTRMDQAHEPAGANAWAVACGAGDVLHIVWTERTAWAAGTGTDSYLKYSQFNTTTGLWGSVETIDNALGVSEIGQGDELVALAVDAAGTPHVAYLKGSPRRVNYRNRAGGTWSAATQVADQALTGNQKDWHPGIAFDGSGRSVVTWQRGSFNGDTDGTHFARVYASGAWGTTHQIATSTFVGIDQGTPVYVDGSGRYHLTLLSAAKYIQYYYSDDQGATWPSNHPGSGTALGDDPAVGPGAGSTVRIYAHGDPSTNITYWEGAGGSGAWGTRQNYITATGYDCSVNVRWCQYYHWYPHALDIAYWKSDYPTNTLSAGLDLAGTDVYLSAAAGTATAAAIVPAAVGVPVHASVTAVVMAANASLAAPSVAGVRQVAVTGVAAMASAAGVAPMPAGVQSPTVNAPAASASAAGVAPAAGSTVNGSVTATAAGASAGAQPPMATGVRNASGAAVVATAPAAAVVPAVAGVRNATVIAVVAGATAAALAPIPTTAGSVVVQVLVAGAEASLPAPAVSAVRQATVTAVAATSAAQGCAPAVDVAVGVGAVVAQADAALPAPTVAGIRNAEIMAQAAQAMAAARAPRTGIAASAVTVYAAALGRVSVETASRWRVAIKVAD